jgi:cytochrome c oxidase assembly factor CtaG
VKPRTLAFVAGLLAILAALEVDDQRLSGHMIQHLLLIEVAPALLLSGRAVHHLLRALPPRPRRSFGRGLVAVGRRAHPALCLTLFAVIVLGTHVPVVFDACARHDGLHIAQHGAYLFAGFVMWWPLLGEPIPRRRLGTIGQLSYITVAMLPMTLLGAYLNRDQTLFYPAYAGPGALLDQQRAGAIMWVGGTTLMAAVGLVAVLRSMLAAERRQRARELHEVAR